jgi:hypothetical protein
MFLFDDRELTKNYENKISRQSNYENQLSILSELVALEKGSVVIKTLRLIFRFSRSQADEDESFKVCPNIGYLIF